MGKYAEYIMELEREKLGLDSNDTSKDVEIEERLSSGTKMSKSSEIEIDKESFWNIKK